MNEPFFEWDERKAALNAKRRGVAFETAAQVLSNRSRVVIDERHSTEKETRFRALGMVAEQYYVVVYTIRGDAVRIISAWKVSDASRYP